MKLLILAALAALLTGCAGLAERAVGDVDEPRFAFVLADIDAAQALAVAANDPAAVQCYTTLSGKVERLGGRLELPVVGVVSAYQRARNVRRLVTGGVSDELRAACAWMLMDSRSFLRRLGTLGVLP